MATGLKKFRNGSGFVFVLAHRTFIVTGEHLLIIASRLGQVEEITYVRQGLVKVLWTIKARVFILPIEYGFSKKIRRCVSN